MLLNKQQLTESLLQLVQGDYELLSNIMTEYVDQLNAKDLQHYEDIVNMSINELI